jgi:hypothetical protein
MTVGPAPQLGPGAGWVDIASRVIVQVGFPVVVAGVLLWFLLTRFQTNIALISDRMAHNTAAAELLVESEQAQLEQLEAMTAELRAQTKILTDYAERQRQLHPN